MSISTPVLSQIVAPVVVTIEGDVYIDGLFLVVVALLVVAVRIKQ